MNQVELLQGEMAALAGRVRKLEVLVGAHVELSVDERAAQLVAQDIGFDPGILVLPDKFKERRALARHLRKQKWSASRIARALNCDQRTVGRWIV